jgi:large subunit ribosomal protein L22
MIEARAHARFVRLSPRKARQVMDLIRGKPVEEALRILELTPRRAARTIEKTLRSAVANAKVLEKSGRLTAADLTIRRALVDEAAALKRWMPRAMGRASVIRRRTSHFTLVVAGEAKTAPSPRRGRGAAARASAKSA